MGVDEIVEGIKNRLPNDGSADYIQLHEQLAIIGTVAETILGLLVTIIVIGVPLVVAVELLYINFPVLQQTYHKALIKTTGRVNKTLGLVIRDARIAVEKVNTVDAGKSVNMEYLKIKSKAIFIATLTVGLVLGAGTSVIQLIYSIARSILEGFRMVN